MPSPTPTNLCTTATLQELLADRTRKLTESTASVLAVVDEAIKNSSQLPTTRQSLRETAKIGASAIDAVTGHLEIYAQASRECQGLQAAWSKAIDDRSGELATLDRLYEQSKEKFTHRSLEIANLRMQKVKEQDELASVQAQLLYSQSELSKTEHDLGNTAAEHTALQTAIRVEKEQQDEKKKRLDDWEVQLQNQAAEQRDLKERLNAGAAEHNTRELSVVQKETKASSDADDNRLARGQLDLALSSLRRLVYLLEVENVPATLSAHDIASAVTSQIATFRSRVKAHETLIHTLTELRAEHESTIEHQQATVNQQKSDLQKIHGEKEHLQRHCNTLQAKSEEAKQSVTTLSGELKSTKTALQTTHEEKDHLQEQYNTLQPKLEQAEQSVTTLSGELESTKTALQSEITRISSELAGLRQPHDERKNALQSLQQELQQQQQGHEEVCRKNTDDLARLQGELKDLEEEKADLEAQFAEADTARKLADEASQGIQTKLGDLLRAHETLKSDLGKTNTELKSEQEKVTGMSQEAQTLRTENQDLRLKLAEAEQKLDIGQQSSSENSSRLEGLVEGLRQEVEETKGKIASEETRASDASTKYREVSKAHRDLQSKCTKLTDQVGEASRHVKGLQDENTTLEQQVARLQPFESEANRLRAQKQPAVWQAEINELERRFTEQTSQHKQQSEELVSQKEQEVVSVWALLKQSQDQAASQTKALGSLETVVRQLHCRMYEGESNEHLHLRKVLRDLQEVGECFPVIYNNMVQIHNDLFGDHQSALGYNQVLSAIRDWIKTTSCEKQQLSDQLTGKTTELEQLQEQLSTRTAALDQDRETMKAQLAGKIAKIHKQMSLEIANLKAQLTGKTKKLEELQTLSSKTTDFDLNGKVLEAQLTSKTDAIARLQAQLSRTTEELQADRNTLELQADQLTGKTDEVTKLQEQLSTTQEDLQADRDTLKLQADQLTGKTNEIADLQESLREKDDELMEKADRLAETKQKLSALQERLRIVRGQREDLRKQHEASKAEVAELTQQLNDPSDDQITAAKRTARQLEDGDGDSSDETVTVPAKRARTGTSTHKTGSNDSNSIMPDPSRVNTGKHISKKRGSRTATPARSRSSTAAPLNQEEPWIAVEDFRNPSFMYEGPPAAVFDLVRQKFGEWDEQKSNWMDGTIKGGPKCVSRWLKQRSSDMGPGQACRNCNSDHKLCVAVSLGKIQLRPLPLWARAGIAKDSMAYWVQNGEVS
ncbi:MAG: hypothetical protein Q9218_005153 [Villophora microphyllina]